MIRTTAVLTLMAMAQPVLADRVHLHDQYLERFDERRYTCKQIQKIAKKKKIIKISGGAIVAGSSLYCADLDSEIFLFYNPDAIHFSAKDGSCQAFSCTGEQDNDSDRD